MAPKSKILLSQAFDRKRLLSPVLEHSGEVCVRNSHVEVTAAKSIDEEHPRSCQKKAGRIRALRQTLLQVLFVLRVAPLPFRFFLSFSFDNFFFSSFICVSMCVCVCVCDGCLGTCKCIKPRNLH